MRSRRSGSGCSAEMQAIAEMEGVQVKQNGTGRTVVQMFQSSLRDNGQTALAMVLTCLGCPVSPWELEAVDSAADLVRGARARGFYAEGCRMTVRELWAAPLPAIVHWHSRSFVVVSRIRGNRVWVNDPEQGLRVLTMKEFDAGFSNTVVCFAGREGLERKAERPPAGELFARFPAAAFWMGAAQAFISACCAAAVILLRLYVAGVSGTAPLFCVPMALLLAAALFQMWLGRRCERELRGRASRYCADRMGEKSPLFFRRVQMHQVACACRSCGAVGAAVRLDVHTMYLWTAGVCLILTALQDLWAGGAALAAAVVFTLWAKGKEELLCSRMKQAGRDRFQLDHQTARRLDRTDSLGGEQRRCFEQWLYQAGGHAASGAADGLLWAWGLFASVTLAAVLSICLTRMAAGRLGLEETVGCAGAALFFVGAMGALPRRVGEQAELRVIRETFEALFRESSVQTQKSAPPAPAEDAEELMVQNIDLPPIREGDTGFRGVSLSVGRGEVLSVWAEGGDRLTLSRLMAGMVLPAQGGVYIDGTDVQELREEELYRRIALLGRGIPLPYGTVRENIAAGCGGISDFAVVQAASDALLHDRVLLREKGYDTPARLLSSGERVLLEFACAFARGTPFLVADACTRQLDPETERRLLDRARSRGAGVVLVTDREPFFRWADTVCRIEGGQVTLRERVEIVDWEGETLVQNK